jgi:hypothetical protein
MLSFRPMIWMSKTWIFIATAGHGRFVEERLLADFKRDREPVSISRVPIRDGKLFL